MQWIKNAIVKIFDLQKNATLTTQKTFYINNFSQEGHPVMYFMNLTPLSMLYFYKILDQKCNIAAISELEVSYPFFPALIRLKNVYMAL